MSDLFLLGREGKQKGQLSASTAVAVPVQRDRPGQLIARSSPSDQRSSPSDQLCPCDQIRVEIVKVSNSFLLFDTEGKEK